MGTVSLELLYGHVSTLRTEGGNKVCARVPLSKGKRRKWSEDVNAQKTENEEETVDFIISGPKMRRLRQYFYPFGTNWEHFAFADGVVVGCT